MNRRQVSELSSPSREIVQNRRWIGAQSISGVLQSVSWGSSHLPGQVGASNQAAVWRPQAPFAQGWATKQSRRCSVERGCCGRAGGWRRRVPAGWRLRRGAVLAQSCIEPSRRVGCNAAPALVCGPQALEVGRMFGDETFDLILSPSCLKQQVVHQSRCTPFP